MKRRTYLLGALGVLVGIGLAGSGAIPRSGLVKMEPCACSCVAPPSDLSPSGSFNSVIVGGHVVETRTGLRTTTDPLAPFGWQECSGTTYTDRYGQDCRVVEDKLAALFY
jgi:hypothetical protein